MFFSFENMLMFHDHKHGYINCRVEMVMIECDEIKSLMKSIKWLK